MKLRTMQQGGGLIYTPFIPEQYAGSTGRSSKSDSDSDDPKIDPLDKELIGLMKDQNLLPSDIKNIFSALTSFQRRTQSLSSTAGFGGTDAYRSVMPGMLNIMNLVSQAKFNKGQYDKAVSEIEKHDASSEIAMDSNGRMYVDSEQGLKLIKTTEFDPEKHRPLSNSELLNLRATQFAFNTGMLSDLTDVIGQKDVREQIDAIINNFGNIKSTEFKNKKMQNIAQDLNEPDGIYKITTKYSKADLQDFSGLLFSQLSKNAQNLIKANAAVGNYTPKDYISSIIASQTDKEVDIDYDASASKTVKDTYPERLVTGNGLDPEQWINIMPNNTGITISAYAQNAGPVMKDGNRFDNSNLQIMLSHADGIGGIIDAQSITFGDQLINPTDFKNLMVDTSVNMKRVWLPVHYTSDGRVTPNFEAQQKLEQAQEYVAKQNGQISDAWMEQWLADNLPDAKWDPNTKEIKFDKSKMRPFLVVHGIAARNRVEFDTDSNYLYHLPSDEGRQLKDQYDRIVKQESVSGKIEKAEGKGAARWKYYSGNIYMPISGPAVGAFIYNNQYYPQDTYTDITNKARNSEAQRLMRTNF